MKKKFDYKKFLPKFVISLLIVFFIVGLAWGLNSVLEMEGTDEPDTLTEGIAWEDSKQGVIDMIRTAIDKAEAERPKLTSDDKVVIDEDSLDAGGNEEVLDAAKYINHASSDGEGAVEKLFADARGDIGADYGEDETGKVDMPELTVDDIDEYKVDYIYYVCPSCGNESDKPLDSCEKCGSTRPYVTKYRDEYTITLTLRNDGGADNGDSVLERVYRSRSTDDVKALFAGKYEDFFSLSSLEINYDTLTVTCRVDRLTGKIHYLSLNKGMNVTAGLDFTGAYSSLGSVPLKSKVKESVEYNFSWPGVSLDKHTMSIERKKEDNLEATLTCSEPFPEVVWTSSDESVATVDDKGYIKTGKNFGTATITATMEFQGQTYSDSCVVTCKTSVESVDISKRKLTLNVGGSYTEKTKLSPSDADIKTYKWYSADESVAVVSEDGTITAVSPGKVKVYVLSDDGYYKATCEVTVNG